jgi:deoxyribonuclease V
MRVMTGISGIPAIRADGTAEALKIQEALRQFCIVRKTVDTGKIRHVAGADAAYAHETIHAAVVVLTFPALEVVEKACTVQKIPFPYIPGLLSFREGPAILDAFLGLSTVPDLIFLNGHGYAHPRRFGIASHIGLLLDIPSVGVAQRLLTGTAASMEEARGSMAPVTDRDEVIGMAVRTISGRKPIFISAGHRVDLAMAAGMALRSTRDHRITEPVWHADRASRQSRDTQSGT